MAHGLKIIAAALVLVVALGSPVWAQNDRQFASDAGLLFNPIRPSKTADFERVVGRIRDALLQSSDPIRQQQAEGWKVFRSPGLIQGNAMYIFIMDPAVPGANYAVSTILNEAFPNEVAQLYSMFSESFNGGQSVMDLTLVADFDPGTQSSTPTSVFTLDPPLVEPRTAVATDDEIRELMIAESLASYQGSCPCPYFSDRAGRQCGGRSAYSRPGGSSPLCYKSDVSDAAVAAYRTRQQR